jgi:hypothetical protein
VSVTDAIGLSVARKLNLPVEIVYTRTGDRLIDGLHIEEAIESIGNNITAGFGVSQHSHAIGSGLEFYTDGRTFLPGLIHYDSGLNLKVERFTYEWLGQQKRWAGGTVNLTPYVPATASTWRWVKVGIDPVTNTVVVGTSTPISTSAALTYAALQAIDFSNKIPLVGYKLRNGAVSIDTENDYEDLRNWFDVQRTVGTTELNTTVVDFAYNTTSPLTLRSALNGEFIQSVSLIVDTAFDGTVTLTIGDTGNNSRFMSSSMNDPATVGEYLVRPLYEYGADTTVKLYLSVTGGTVGVGRVIIESSIR